MLKYLYLLLLMIHVTWSQNVKQRTIVLAFDGDANSTPYQRQAIADHFQSELMKTDSFIVLDRSQYTSTPKETFSTQKICVDTICKDTLISRILIDQKITGNVVNFGNSWSISVRSQDVVTGALIRSESIEVTGSLATILSKACPILAKRMAGISLENTPVIAIKEPTPILSDSTTPAPVITTETNTKSNLNTYSLKPAEKKLPSLNPTTPTEVKPTKSSYLKWGGLLLGALGFSLAESKNSEIKTLNKEASSANDFTTYDNKVNEARSAELSRNIYYGLGGIGVASFTWSLTF